MPRVLITGIGVIAPSGLGHVRYWDAILNGPSLIGPISRFDATGYACRIGGQVDDRLLDDNIDPRKQRAASHVSRMALVAAEDSLQDARLSLEGYQSDAVGVCVGTALGGWIDGEKQYGILLERGARRVNPFLATGAGTYGPGIEVAAAVGAHGPHLTFSSGCPAGLQAVGHGAQLIANGLLDVCLVGGTESPLSPVVVAAMSRTQELSTTNDDPRSASKPFDAAHNGMVLTEGSCFLVLESEESASARSAHRYAEILGSISSCDAQGFYGTDADGETAGRAMHRLLRTCSVTPTEINYVCAHANGSPSFDRKETVVLKKVFGEFAAKIPVSSIKGVLGHPFGASGAFQVAASALAINHGQIPPTHNLGDPAPDCDLDYVPVIPRSASIDTALVTSYGYGGINSFLLLRKPS